MTSLHESVASLVLSFVSVIAAIRDMITMLTASGRIQICCTIVYAFVNTPKSVKPLFALRIMELTLVLMKVNTFETCAFML